MAPNLTYQADVFGFAYAGFTLLGGLIGLIKAGSIPSLVASAVCAALIYAGADRASRDPRDVRLALGVSVALFFFFGNKYRKSGKIMPGAVMTLFSLAAVVRYGVRLL